MDAFYVKGVVNFDFLFDTMTRNVCFCVVFNVTPFLVRAKCPRNGGLSGQMFSICHSFFVKAKCPRNG